MRRFNANKKWTDDTAAKLVDFMREAATAIDSKNGFFKTYQMTEMQKFANPSILWNGYLTWQDWKGLRSAGLTMHKSPGMIIYALFDAFGDEKQKAGWVPWSNTGFSDPINCQNVADNLNDIMDRSGSLLIREDVSYGDVIDLLNVLDLNSATAKAVSAIKAGDKAGIEKSIDDAISCMEASCSASTYNSNLSGEMYSQLLEVKKNIEVIKKADADNITIDQKARLALNLDKLDCLAARYVKYKADKGYRETAYGKLKAAFQIRKITKYCYGLADTVVSTKDMNGDDIQKKINEFKDLQSKSKQNGRSIPNAAGSKFFTEQNRYAILAKDIHSDNSLRNAVNARNAAANNQPQLPTR